ncbi:MAG: transcription termination factor Rho [Marmoricola sp.]|nr:transcription termination factor Rho [Marmoricola sp.]
MTETTETAPAAGASSSGARKGGGLNAMLLPELKQIAGSLGIKATGLRKGALIEAIKSAQGGGQSSNQSSGQAKTAARNPETQPRESQPGETQPRETQPRDTQSTPTNEDSGRNAATRAPEQTRERSAEQVEEKTGDRRESTDERRHDRQQDRDPGHRNDQRNERNQNDRNQPDRNQGDRNQGDRNQNDRSANDRNQNDRSANDDRSQGAGNRNQAPGNRANDDDGDGSRRNRRRRGRDRNERNDRPQTTSGNQGGAGGGNPRGNRNEPDMQVLDDDVLAPCAGILDLMDNYAFVRTSGYLPGSDDVYVSMSMVRKFGLRRGDAITGQVRQPREGERKEKYNPLVKLDSVNGADPEEARTRVEFSKLTPLYPSERLRLETSSTNLIGRVIDIAAPIGKGQRGLIVSPSKAGKTMIMQSIANSITTNNPECHLMVVLVDERPEEVTDFERSVKGEVVSSTFDRPASDHTIVAELAIERAKRLVELGHDVVVLLDGITRLGRAYNLAAPASGRILSGGVDSAALYPPKRFFGAARNIEDGGSLTILATALIESGSKMDEVIFEEFKGTGNMEIRLRRDFADKRIFPAIDAVQSGTRREELLMSKEELSIVWKLRRVLSGLDGQQALELLLERLKKSKNNLEFLMQVQKTTPTAGGQGD